MTDLEALARLVTYCPSLGEFRAGGRLLGTNQSRGYTSIKYAGKAVLAHRLAWFMCYGTVPRSIDHINRDKRDNRIENLRQATASENQCNRGVQSNNTSGCAGVALNRQGTKWQAYIKKDGRRKHLGVFERKEEAIACRKAAEAELFGAFAPA
jgi:hypothetical protein